MTNEDFAHWLSAARVRFPSVARMLDGMKKDEMSSTTLFWLGRIRKYDLAAATDALDSLFDSEKRIYPADWFQAFTKSLSFFSSERSREQARTQRYDGEPLNTCRYACTMDGFVPILNYPRSIGKATYVACACDKGNNHAARGMYRFKPGRDKHADQPAVAVEPGWKTQGDVR